MHSISGSVVLSLCDRSSVMVAPWIENGYTAICVDLQHEPGWKQVKDGLWLVGANIKTFLPPRADYVAAFAFPPCTNLAVSGARWFREKGLRGLIEGLELVERCRELLEWCDCPWLLENPVSTISSYWRKPDHSFDPCDYGGYLTPPGDKYTKRTCLWVGGGFRMPPLKSVEPVDGSRMHTLPPTKDRADIRSQTPEGFARAVFECNGKKPVPSEELQAV